MDKNDNTGSQIAMSQMQDLFEAMQLGVAVFDADQRLTIVSDTFRKLVSFANFEINNGMSLRDLYTGLASSGAFGTGVVDDIVTAHLVSRSGNDPEEILTSPENSLLQIKRYSLQSGGLCAVLRDVTEERATQEQLWQASKLDAIGRLTGGVAHDFNNVLAVIFGNLELLKEATEAPALHRMVDSSMAAAERGAKLTHRLLAFARKQPLSPEVVCPGQALRDLVPMLRSLLGENIEVELISDAGIWPIEVDRNQLDNVLINIAINARDAMSGGGKLTIEALNARVDDHYAKTAEIDRGQYVCIACSDTGTGMAKPIVEKAFEPFFTTKDISMGTGLGLAMAHGFVKQSKGHIKIYSELGEGTVVKIYLPRALSVSAGSSELEHVSVGSICETFVVLLVEDDSAIRETVQAQLESAGYSVISAWDAGSALELHNSNAIDLLLTDVVLPGEFNGKQLAEKLTELQPSLPVVFMSGYTENAIIHHGRLDKGVTLLQKPFRKSDLLQTLSDALSL
ncbi:response regulator [Shimia sp. R9_3]|uniref:response regulator n=1 Tax=Shimia sp. R9_3 TaxID=2821113 RepID=UPI001B126FF3|nr:response regulator [Shimia sp. R9_3]MBO9403377.1 response regulator [Shimia sp. R9_3]